MTALLISGDLAVVARFQGAVARANAPAEAALNLPAALEMLTRRAFDVVIVDLSLPGIDPAEIRERVQAIAKSPPRVVAFAPHVHEARLSAAQAAGCEAISRGQFERSVEQIITGKSGSPTQGQ